MARLPDFLSDVSLKTSGVQPGFVDATSRGVLWQVESGRFLLDLPGIARYLVEAGERITIEQTSAAEPMVVDHFLRMTPVAALLYQRGIPVFHAAAVVNERGDAVLLAGDSGTGKSTLLAALLQRGWTMLADDLAVVSFDGRGQPVVHPVFPGISLWPETLQNLGLWSGSLARCDANRHLLPRDQQFSPVARPLRAIYHLAIHNQDEILSTVLAGAEGFKTVGLLLYNSHIAAALLDRVSYFRHTAAIVQSVTMSRLYRPRGKWSVAALADFIVKNLS